MKKISIIVPMYNEEKVIEECYKRLTKILQQIENYKYEIVTVNDGSKDETLEMLEEIARNDTNFKIISFFLNF